MRFNSKDEQIYDWQHSQHNILISIMVMMGIGVGFLVYDITGFWVAIPICIMGSFAFPLGDNIRRRIMHKKNGGQ